MKQLGTSFSVLKFRDFRYLWIGMLLSRIGSEMQVVALSWHVYQMTGSALSLGIIGLSRFLPVVFFSLLGGIAADRFDRRRVMLVAQCTLTIIALVLAAATSRGWVTPHLIYMLIAVGSLFMSFETPSRQSILPYLVPKEYFPKAVSLNTIGWQSAVVIGPSIGGFAIAYFGVSSVYIINAISYLAVIGALLLMKPHKKPEGPVPHVNIASLKEGLRFVFRTPIIYSSMLLDFFATFFSSATVLLPIFAKDILLVDARGLGILYAAPSVGGVLAGVVYSSFKNIQRQGMVLLSAVFIYGLATIGFGLSQTLLPALIFLSLMGAGDIVSTIIRNTIRQLETPDHLRGRMVSINMIFFMGGPQLGELEAGVIAAIIGASGSVVLGGIGAIMATVAIGCFFPKLRTYQSNK